MKIYEIYYDAHKEYVKFTCPDGYIPVDYRDPINITDLFLTDSDIERIHDEYHIHGNVYNDGGVCDGMSSWYGCPRIILKKVK